LIKGKREERERERGKRNRPGEKEVEEGER
jgi:hypothetical protein